MLRTQIKLTFRNLLNNRLFFLINLGGLAIGISSTLMIGLYCFYVINYDRFHNEAEHIYLVYKERVTPNGTQSTYDTWVPLLSKLKTDFPQIKSGTRVYESTGRIMVDEKSFDEEILLADPDFFNVFTFIPSNGRRGFVLPEMKSAAITRETAHKLFGLEDATGRSFRLKNPELGLDTQYQVSAILEDHPNNSSINPNIVIPFESLPAYSRFSEAWSTSFISTYIRLDNREAKGILEASFPKLVSTIWDDKTSNNTNLKLLPLTKSYETFLGDLEMTYILLCIGLGILIMAIINYINLTTARSTYLGRQVGIKKVLGAGAAEVRVQFMLESILTVLFAGSVAFFILYPTIPYVNDLIDMKLDRGVLLDPIHLTGIFSALLLIGLLAGVYPSMYLGRFNAAHVVNRMNSSKEKARLRNGLVLFQFSLATILIVSTLVISSQIKYLKTAPMGFKGDNLMILSFDATDFENSEIMSQRQRVFYGDLQNLTDIVSQSFSRHIPTRWSDSFTFVKPEGWTGDPLRMRYTFIDNDFFNTYGIDITTGQGFDHHRDHADQVILNQAALKALGVTDPSVKQLQLGGQKFNILGVTTDFNFETMRNSISPTLHFYQGHQQGAYPYLTLRVESDSEGVYQQIEATWNKSFPGVPFAPQYLDSNVSAMYQEEDRFLTLNTLLPLLRCW